VSLEKRSGM
jgi:hypothetical protein